MVSVYSPTQISLVSCSLCNASSDACLLQEDIVDKLMSRGSLALMNRSPGHKREFSLNDISIQHTFAEHERVPPLYVSLLRSADRAR